MAYAIYALLFASNPMMYKVYYSNAEGTHLVGVDGFEKLQGVQLYSIALNQLMLGPDEEGLVSTIPSGTKMVPFGDDLGPIVEGEASKTVMLNFSKELVENHSGEANEEKMTIGAIVNTMTSFKAIDKVEIYVEGELLETLAGHMEIKQPFEEFSDLIK